MIIDTSALVAILKGEHDARDYAAALAQPGDKLISAATMVEVAIVIDAQKDPILSRRLDELIALTGIKIEAMTSEHAALARAAYRDFGRGSGHPANLNFGDCFAYALAKARRQRLLFKGDDFSQTDMVSALEA